MTTSYDAFLSHDVADEAAVESIAKQLREAGLKVFFAKWHLVPGEPWQPALEAAIEASTTVAVFVGAKGMSGWHDQEKQLGLVLAAQERGKRVIPVLLKGATIRQVKGFLGLRTWVEFAAPDGLRRLVAGIVGEAPDENGEFHLHPTSQPRWNAASVELARQTPFRSNDGFDEYCHRLRAEHQYLELIGFDTQVSVAIGLEDLYVPLDVVLDHGPRGRVVHSNAQLAKQYQAPGLRRRSASLADAFGLVRSAGKRGAVLLGDPGSGKTTQLRRMLLQLLSSVEGGGPKAVGLPEGTLPVFLPLRRLAEMKAFTEDAAFTRLEDLDLAEFMQRVLTGPIRWAPADLAKRLLMRGRLLLLLDGLDEVADETERHAVAKWIGAILRHSPDSYVLVSSRYAGYTKAVKLDPQFLELHLRPLDDGQIETFVNNWYRVVRAREAEIGVTVSGPQNASEMLAELRAPDFRGEARLYQLSANPLLLTALCLVHRRQGNLPRARELLYQECTTVLLEGWRERGVIASNDLSPEQSRRVLQSVAWWMHGKEGRTQASTDELSEPVKQGFKAIGQPVSDPKSFLKAIRDESGLLTGWGLDRYGFMHLGLQEYLAALELRTQSKSTKVMSGLAVRFGSSWWQEVILLMLAGEDHAAFGRFMGLVLEQDDFVAWAHSSVMQRLLAEPTEEMARPFIALLQRTHGMGNLSGRQQAAAELLERHMRWVVDAHVELLENHPVHSVREWWRRLQRPEIRGLEVTIAPQGGVELVRIPGGTFQMGSPVNEEGRLENEGPQHSVTLRTFYLARRPVTNRQYGEYLKSTGARPPEYWGSQEYNQPEQPVVGVSWEDASAYCEWAGLTLPTEAQWEYACRARTTTRYCSGDSVADLGRVGWYKENSGRRLHPVGELAPNGFGLYDMHGNNYEWCRDRWVENYTEVRHAAQDGLRLDGPPGEVRRTMRGGDWGGDASDVRSASRSFHGPAFFRLTFTGIRPSLQAD